MRARRLLWLVYEEWSGGEALAVPRTAYLSQASAEGAAQRFRAEHARDGQLVWCYPTTDDQPSDWDVDVHVEPVAVKP